MKNIHLFRSVAIVVALISMAIGCSKDDEFSSDNQMEQYGKEITLTANCDIPQTKVSYAEGEGKLDVFWKTNDAFRLYSGEKAPTGNFILSEADNGKNSGEFSGIASAGTFNAFFPAQTENSKWSTLNMSYEGQEQDGMNTTTHLANYNYMTAQNIVIVENKPTASFNFSHLGSVLQFDITLPEDYDPIVDGQPTEIILTAPGLVKSVKPSGAVGDATSSLTLKLKNISLTTVHKTFTAYMMCAPFTIPQNGSLKISLLCSVSNAAGNITRTFYEFEKSYPAGKNYETGKRYLFENLGTINPFTPKKIITIGGVDFSFILVRAGIFQMGSPENEGYPAEHPQHWVKISKDYYIGETEVTNAQWKIIMGSNTDVGEELLGSNNPVVGMYRTEITDVGIGFLDKIKTKTPGTPIFNLPTEAQWEYAARGGHKNPGYMLYAGTNDENELPKYAWFLLDNDDPEAHKSKAVKGNRLPNALDLYDMSGNVEEWCLDNYAGGDTPYPAGGETMSDPVVDPYIATGDLDIFRGGSWFFTSDNCKVAYRNGNSQASATYVGFRLILIP